MKANRFLVIIAQIEAEKFAFAFAFHHLYYLSTGRRLAKFRLPAFDTYCTLARPFDGRSFIMLALVFGEADRASGRHGTARNARADRVFRSSSPSACRRVLAFVDSSPGLTVGAGRAGSLVGARPARPSPVLAGPAGGIPEGDRPRLDRPQPEIRAIPGRRPAPIPLFMDLLDLLRWAGTDISRPGYLGCSQERWPRGREAAATPHACRPTKPLTPGDKGPAII